MAERRGRKAVVIELSEDQREELEGVVRRCKSPQDLVLRCQVVLGAADGLANVDIAKRLGCHQSTAGKWRKRYAVAGIQGLCDAPRSGAPRTVTDDQVERVVRTTLEETPENATHWSTRSMAAHLGMSRAAVHRIWRAFELKPHLVDWFKVSPDPFFVDKVHDVVGLYLDPPDAAVVLCVDEKTQIQALTPTAPILPMIPGVPQRRSSDYKRNGTTNLYAALDAASGKVITRTADRARAVEFLEFLDLIDAEIPEHLAVHIVLDNVSSHKTQQVVQWQLEHPRFEFHFTPTYSAWMNLVERWFGELTAKWLRRGVHPSVEELTESINTWIETWNDNPRPFVWRKPADKILKHLKRYLQRINKTEH